MEQKENIPLEPVWTVTSNIVEERTSGPDGFESHTGTKHFSPGTKVYIIDWFPGVAERIVVVGLSRKPKRFIKMVIPATSVQSFRIKMCYEPGALKKIYAHFETQKDDISRLNKEFAEEMLMTIPQWQSAMETDHSRPNVQKVDVQNFQLPKKDSIILKIITAYIGIILCYSIYQNYHWFLPQFISVWSLEILLSIFLLSTSIYGLIFKKRIGWICLVGFFSFQFASQFLKLFEALIEVISVSNVDSNVEEGSDFGTVDLDNSNYISGMIGRAFGVMLVTGSIVWFLSKSSIKRLFNITNELRNKVILIGLILGLIIWGWVIWGW